MKRSKLWLACAGIAGLVLCAMLLLYQVPSIKSRVDWRVEIVTTYLRAVANPAGALPTPIGTSGSPGTSGSDIETTQLPQPRVSVSRKPTTTPTLGPAPCQGSNCAAASSPTPPARGATQSPSPIPTATPTLLPLPDSASLPAPIYEKQDANNCGPGTLTMYLRSYGWKGDQNVIAKVIKPDPNDRNVNVDELVYFVRTQVGWLNAGFRVGGDIDLLKRFIANGMPIMIEETSLMDKQYWPGDDLWAGHYLLLTAYDDAKQQFTSQDSWLGPNLLVDYKVLDGHWQSFNRAYIMVYQPGQEELVQAILRENWDPTVNRQNALNKSESETISDPKNAFAWFNLGTNLLYFERYREAAAAYDQARQIGLPQRMLRYQFGPFIAYFRTNRIDDLKALTDFALKITANSEENLLWDGWALYVKGKKVDAVAQFKAALKVNPFYADAQYALNYVGAN
jgi:hypothetical protein